MPYFLKGQVEVRGSLVINSGIATNKEAGVNPVGIYLHKLEHFALKAALRTAAKQRCLHDMSLRSAMASKPYLDECTQNAICEDPANMLQELGNLL